MTEKSKPHYLLEDVKRLVANKDTRRITMTALKTAADMDITVEGIVECVQGLDSTCFFKSMTTQHDHTLWQDVYKPVYEEVFLYIKVQIVEDYGVVISFKRSEEGG